MKHDLIHIQGKPYVLVPLHEYRMMDNAQDAGNDNEIPADVLDRVYAGQESPVKILRKFRGMTQQELAAAAGISRPYLTEIETGRKPGSISALKSLSEALKAPVGLLV
jgi:DNA-binding XRE family transcriptional regulator